MYCIASLSVAQTRYDPLGLLYSNRRNQTRGLQAQKLSQLGISWIWRTRRDGALQHPCWRACLERGPASTLHVHMCNFGMHSGWGYRPGQVGLLCRDFIGAGHGEQGRTSGQLGSMCHRMCVYTRAFNPQSGGDGGPGRAIMNLAGVGLLTYLIITGRLDWLFDAILTLWLISTVLWWFAERSLVKGPCPNCGGEFQVFEFTLKEEYRLCPYCSQPFKLENKKFVRDGPQFSNQQTRGFRQPFQGFGGFEDFGRPTSSRKTEDSSGVVVDVEAEVRDKD